MRDGRRRRIAQYDYGWFVGYNGARPNDAIGYVDASESYGGFPGASPAGG